MTFSKYQKLTQSRLNTEKESSNRKTLKIKKFGDGIYEHWWLRLELYLAEGGKNFMSC